MKFLSTIVLFIISLSCFGQYDSLQVELTMADSKINVQVDSVRSYDNYWFYNCPDLVRRKVRYENIPSNEIKSTDEYGEPFNYIDDKSVFLVRAQFQIEELNDLSLDISINGLKASKVKFHYQVLSKTKRVSHSTVEIETDSIGAYFQELYGDLNKPVILIFALEHTSEIGYWLTFDMGYIAFEIEN